MRAAARKDKLLDRADRTTVAAAMSWPPTCVFCIVDSDIGSVRPTEAWALAQHTRKFSFGPGPALGPGHLGALGPLGSQGFGPNTAMAK